MSLGEGWTPLVAGDVGRRAGPVQARVPDADRVVQGPRHDGDGELPQEPRRRPRARGLLRQRGRVALGLRGAAGLTCRILVPETASYPKIAQIAACGADVVTIKGSRQDVAEAALRQSAEIFYASHNWQPFFVEGTKTLAYELWEQSGFRAPDNVVVPLGYGSNVLGAERGFDELLRAGEIARRPRLFGVQAADCAPYYGRVPRGRGAPRAHDDRADRGRGHRHAKPTAGPRGAARGARERRQRGGGGGGGDRGGAPDLARRGLYVEPTAAAAAAGLTRLLASGVIRPREDTVLVLTGSGLKASATIGELLKLAPRVTLSLWGEGRVRGEEG